MKIKKKTLNRTITACGTLFLIFLYSLISRVVQEDFFYKITLVLLLASFFSYFLLLHIKSIRKTINKKDEIIEEDSSKAKQLKPIPKG